MVHKVSIYRQVQLSGNGIPCMIEYFYWNNKVKQWVGSFGSRYNTVKDMKKGNYRVRRVK